MKENSQCRKLPVTVLMPNPNLLFTLHTQFHRIGLDKISNFIGKSAKITFWEKCLTMVIMVSSIWFCPDYC